MDAGPGEGSAEGAGGGGASPMALPACSRVCADFSVGRGCESVAVPGCVPSDPRAVGAEGPDMGDILCVFVSLLDECIDEC